jgi:acetyl-CoA carboxylase carboxyltransferase component
MFEAQADVFYTSGLLLDDGVIDPRDTRAVLAFCLDTMRRRRGAAAAADAVRRGAHVEENRRQTTATNTSRSRRR